LKKLREDSLILSYAKKAITINDHFGSSSRKTTSSEFSSSGNKNTNSLWEDAKRLVKEKGAEFFVIPQDCHSPVIHNDHEENPSRRKTRPSHQIWVLSGDISYDSKLRAEHRYTSAPNINLAKSLLDLCQDARQAAWFCIGLCDELTF